MVETSEDDFLGQLDDKLMRVNGRKWVRLKAWGEILDAAGWCVALPMVGGEVWLSPNARRERHTRDAVPSGEPVGGGVYIWPSRADPHGAADLVAGLTAREQEVLNWLRSGKSDAEIAVILGRAVRTVEKHVANLYQKLGVKSRSEAIFNSIHPDP